MCNFAMRNALTEMETSQEPIILSKEQLAQMPVVAFHGRITVVNTPEQAHAALGVLSEQKAVGFDTETKPNFHKGQNNTVALVQLATADHSYLFRINKMGFFQELIDFFENPAVTKVGLSIKDDFHNLHKLAPFDPQGFIELQDAVKSYEIGEASLQKVYGIIFGERISKAQRLSNWEAPSLSNGQQSYASIDAWACLKIYNTLSQGSFLPDQVRQRLSQNA